MAIPKDIIINYIFKSNIFTQYDHFKFRQVCKDWNEWNKEIIIQKLDIRKRFKGCIISDICHDLKNNICIKDNKEYLYFIKHVYESWDDSDRIYRVIDEPYGYQYNIDDYSYIIDNYLLYIKFVDLKTLCCMNNILYIFEKVKDKKLKYHLLGAFICHMLSEPCENCRIISIINESNVNIIACTILSYITCRRDIVIYYNRLSNILLKCRKTYDYNYRGRLLNKIFLLVSLNYIERLEKRLK